MSREDIMAILYEMAMVIGGETRVRPLLTKVLQKFLYHTSFPCGMIFLDTLEKIAAGGQESIDLRLELAIGDYEMAERTGEIISVPAALLRGDAALIEAGDLLKTLPCRKGYYSHVLRLPIDDIGVILLLSPALPDTKLPLTSVFQPVMGNLAKAILLCRHNEAYTSGLISERDLARLEFERVSHRNKLILDSVGEGIYGADTEGKTTFVNPAALKMLGYEASELIGRPAHDAIHHTRADGTPYPAAECPIDASRKDGSLHMVVDEVFWKKDGASFPVEYVSAPILEGDRIVGSVVVFEDITERKEAEETIRKVNRALKTLSSCNMTLIHAVNEEELLRDVCRTVVEVGGYRMSWVGLSERDGKTLRPSAYACLAWEMETAWIDTLARCPIALRALVSGETTIVDNILTNQECLPYRQEALKRGYASFISLPMRTEGDVLGVLNIHASQPGAFNAEEVRLLEELGSDLAYGIATLRTRSELDQAHQERQRFIERLMGGLEDTVQAIAATIEMRDPYTAGHQRRVADLASAIAREMALPEEKLRSVHIAGTVHDLGKIYIPAEILSKPRRLNEPEFNLIKLHPQVGYDILKEVEFPWPIAQMVLQHHEKLDGSGYPNGLKDNEILLEARILTVADEVEALMSHRPYRPGFGLDVALGEIVEKRGICYDPDVVDACVKLFREKGYSFE